MAESLQKLRKSIYPERQLEYSRVVCKVTHLSSSSKSLCSQKRLEDYFSQCVLTPWFLSFCLKLSKYLILYLSLK